MRWNRGTALAVCAVLAATGCGEDTSRRASGDRATAPTRSEYIQQADAICERGNAELESAASQYFAEKPHPTAKQERVYATTIFVPNIRAQLEELRELQAPEGDADEVAAIYDAASEGLDEIAADPSSFGGEPPSGFVEAGRLAADYGFKVCGHT